MIRIMQRRVRWRVMLCLTGAAGLAIPACRTETSLTETHGRPECPHTPLFRIRDTVQGRERVTLIQEIPLSGPITRVPEYHDCQRFIVDSAGQPVYGSLYAIYASSPDRSLPAAIDSLQDSVVYPQFVNVVAAVAAATVYSYGGSDVDPGTYDGGSYDPLHIGPGFNCLYLWHRGVEWRAWMINKGPDDPECPSPLVIDSTVPPEAELSVSHVPAPPELGVAHVARWDWDSGGREQYLGISCGSQAWCEVSDEGVSSSAPPFPTPQWETDTTIPELKPEPDELERVHRVKGWYDAQLLAIRSSAGVMPSTVWGVIVPHPTLHRMSHGSGKAFEPGRWVHVAVAWVTADYNGAVLPLKQGQQNNIHLCSGTADDCDIPDSDRDCAVPPGAEGDWWMKVSHQDGTPQYRCGVRRSAPQGVRVPGTARWRWLAKDETLWTRCYEGCCEMQN